MNHDCAKTEATYLALKDLLDVKTRELESATKELAALKKIRDGYAAHMAEEMHGVLGPMGGLCETHKKTSCKEVLLCTLCVVLQVDALRKALKEILKCYEESKLKSYDHSPGMARIAEAALQGAENRVEDTCQGGDFTGRFTKYCSAFEANAQTHSPTCNFGPVAEKRVGSIQHCNVTYCHHSENRRCICLCAMCAEAKAADH